MFPSTDCSPHFSFATTVRPCISHITSIAILIHHSVSLFVLCCLFFVVRCWCLLQYATTIISFHPFRFTVLWAVLKHHHAASNVTRSITIKSNSNSKGENTHTPPEKPKQPQLAFYLCRCRPNRPKSHMKNVANSQVQSLRRYPKNIIKAESSYCSEINKLIDEFS
jgi:hypothetical protein